MKQYTLLFSSLSFCLASALFLRHLITSEVFNNGSYVMIWKIIFKLKYTINTGINFGLAGNLVNAHQLLYACLSVTLCVIIMILGVGSKSNWSPVIAGLFAGGGLANAYERFAYGGVLDYFNVSLTSVDNPFSFNLADVYIFTGLILFISRPKLTD